MPHTVSPAPSGVTALIEDTVHYVTSHLPVTPDCPPPRFSENFPLFNAAHRDLSATLSGPWKEATSAIDAALAGDAGVAWQDGLRRAGDSGESLRRDADEASRVCTHMTTTVMNGALELSRITNDYLNKATPLVNVIMTMAIAKGPLPQAPEQNPLAALHHLSSDARQHADATIHRINADLEQDVTALQKLLDHPAPSYPHCDIDIPPNPPTPTAPATAVPVPTVARQRCQRPCRQIPQVGVAHLSGPPPPPQHHHPRRRWYRL